MAALVLGMAVSVTACRAAVPLPEPGEAAGPEWRTDARRSPGAATRASPAELTGVSVEPHNAYDRVVFAFDGDRPGYRVAYENRAGGPVLRVTISNVRASIEQRLAPETEVVAEVVRYPADDLVVDSVIELSEATADTHPPFRVGLDAGEFYVDVGDPHRITGRKR